LSAIPVFLIHPNNELNDGSGRDPEDKVLCLFFCMRYEVQGIDKRKVNVYCIKCITCSSTHGSLECAAAEKGREPCTYI
jgi:hypothetical protein